MPIVTQVKLLKNRRTKIIATVGPASDKVEVITELIKAGVNIFRLNMSHGDHDFHHGVYQTIRSTSEKLVMPVAILADLCGPKIRTGKFEKGEILLRNGETVTVTTRDIPGQEGLIPSQYGALAGDVKPGNRILLNDGTMELRVENIADSEIRCTVIHGGTLKNHKGINLPGVEVSAPSMTEKDKKDAYFAIDLGVDFLALSFVRRAADIEDLKALINEKNARTAIIAKIEKPEALQEVAGILEAADAIMVARGDLGVELQPEEVPVAQSQLIERAREKIKPVIVATQMLESMIENARPTRAEVTDISHAVTHGTDAVMLSAETAAGAHPIESVKMMDRIVRQTEAYMHKSGAYAHGLKMNQHTPLSIWEAMAEAVNNVTHNLEAKAIVVLSNSGMSAATVATTRPAAPVIAITNDEAALRRMLLLWSVIPVKREEAGSMNPNQLAKEVVQELGIAEPGEHVILVRGFHNKVEMNTPTITALTI